MFKRILKNIERMISNFTSLLAEGMIMGNEINALGGAVYVRSTSN